MSKAYVQFLENLSDMMPRTVEGVVSFVRFHATEMGMKPLGEIKEWHPDTDVFPNGLTATVDWDEAVARFVRIGEPEGVYFVPSRYRFGVRGDKGDATFSFRDIQYRRLQGLCQYLKETK